MRVTMLLDGGKPKVPPEELRQVIEDAGMEVGDVKADLGVVVGGDGRFSRYGRTEQIPLLFVGVRSKGVVGSRAHLAETTYDKLPTALRRIGEGDYKVVPHRRLGISHNGKSIGEVFTDVYLQRGSQSDCIRYRLKVTGVNIELEEAAIGDGVVVTTKAGSSGYYSYLERIKGEFMDPSGFALLGNDEVGIAHINPTYTEREGAGKHPLRYAVPWGTKVELSLFRDADARLYGTTDSKEGVKVALGDKVTVGPGLRTTKVVSLGKGPRQKARRR